MTERNKIGYSVVSILLLVVLMFPMSVQFFHVFGCHAHDHADRQEVGTNVYENESSCHICDFDFVPFGFDVAPFSELYCAVDILVTDEVLFSSLYKVLQRTNNPLRAPPYILA